MFNNELISDSNNQLGFKKIKIDYMDKVDDYLFIALSNGQKVLTNGKEMYDVSEYNHLTALFFMGDKFCAVFTKEFTVCVIDLKTMEVLFEDKDAYHVSKKDDRALHVIMKIGGGDNAIYDIEAKKYLPAPDDYEFENALGNNLYVFRENNNKETNFYDYKRCVININGKVLMKDIDGWIYLSGKYIIIIKKNEICIVGIDEESTLNIKTIKQNKEIIAKPDYYDGNIMIMVKGAIKIYTPTLELKKEIAIEELNEVIDYEIVSNTLKLCLPHVISGELTNKHLFVNLDTGKSISHIRIEGYPYWNPTTYIGKDSIDTKISNYHFYNKDFDSIISVNATSYENVDNDRECVFFISTIENDTEKKQLFNAENGSIREVNYDFIKFPSNHQDGYGVDFTKEKIDFFDEKLEVIIPDFNYKKYKLDVCDFGYFIVNNYICIINHFIDGYGISRDRVILQNSNGDIILDSINHRCFALGNFIQIIDEDESEFLNTLTGEIGQLSISAKVDEKGKIDLEKINNINNILTVNNNTQLSFLATDDNENLKIKKLISKIKKDD